jgi:hypothetical protein
MLKNLLILFVLILRISSLESQISKELENKYWTYRDRFRNYFTKIGEFAGESQTAASIHQFEKTSDSFRRINGIETKVNSRKKYTLQVDYGDAVIDQGWYMMVLASEYWLLKRKGMQHTEAFKAVCNELYFAINAIERLDGTAERIFDRKSTPNLNGFFVRSDHQPDYLSELNKNNVPYNPIEWIKSGGFSGPEFSWIDSSDAIRIYDRDSFRINLFHRFNYSGDDVWYQGGPGQNGADMNWGNEMSQDQLYGLLMGFKAIYNWVDSTQVVDPDGVNPMPSRNLHQWIKSLTHRIMLHVSKSHVGLFGFKDKDDLREMAEKECAQITSRPYYRRDTIYFNPPDTQISRDTFITYRNFWQRDTTIIITKTPVYLKYLDSYSSQWFQGSVFQSCNIWDKLDELKTNDRVFKSGNYIITNPVNNNNLVTRGAVATVFSYPLRVLASSITDHEYPSPFIQFRDGYQGLVWFLTTSDCDLLRYNPNELETYEKIWSNMGKSLALNGAIKKFNEIPLNMMSNLALSTGTWSQMQYYGWAELHGYDYNEIIYALMNSKEPIKPKSFYESVLLKAQCEGPYQFGDPDNGYEREMQKEAIYRPFTVDNVFTQRGIGNRLDSVGAAVFYSGKDYMLMYNLYEMANILYWGGENMNPIVNKPCPCRPDTVFNRSNLINSTFDIENQLTNFYFGTRYITRQDGIYGLSIKPLGDDTVRPHYDYYRQYNVRTPAYLLHNLKVQGTQNEANTITVLQDYRICHGNLELKSFSKLQTIPNGDENFPSLIEIGDEAILTINDGGIVFIQNNTRLVIEPGGTLKYHPGARIILNGPNAVLHIKGKLELAPGATFQVEGGPEGKGYVIWDCGVGSPHFGEAELIAGAGSKMVFSENDINKTALEVRGFSGMYIPAGLAEFKATGCRINLKEQAFIKSAAAHTLVQNVQIFGHNGPSANPDFHWKPSSRGLHIMATPNSIKNATVHDCLEGIKLFYPGGTGHPLNLDSVYFKNCQNAVINHGGRVKWHSGHADNEGTVQLRTALNGIGTQGASELSGILLSHDNFSWMQNPPAKFGISAAAPQSNIWLHGTGRYYLSNKCKVENGKYGAINSQGFIFPHCSEFMNNQSHFYMNQGARLVAQHNSWNSFNWDFSATDKQFYYGVNGTFLYLEKGKNYIKGHQSNQNTRFIEAELHHTHLQETSLGHTGTNSTAIRATGNQWAIGGLQGMETVPQASATANISLLAVAPGVVSAGAYFDVNYLPVSGGNYFSDREAACASNTGFSLTHDWPVDTPFLQTLDAYNPASTQTVMMLAGNLKSAIETPVRNYPQAIDMAKTLFLADLPVNLASPVFDVYSITHSMYPEVFSDSTIAPANHNAVAAATYTAMLNMQQQLISLADSTEPGIWPQYRFEVHRDLALIHRIFNQRNLAIQYLDQVMPTFQKPADLQALQTWRCLIAKEQAYLDSLIPYHLVNFDTCINVLDSLGQIDTNRVTQWHPDWLNRFGEGNEGAAAAPPAYLNEANNTDKIKINVFPNPGTDVWHINATHGQITKVELWSPQGQQLKIETVQGTAGKISISNLPQGIYFLRVYHKGGVQVFRMMKQED